MKTIHAFLAIITLMLTTGVIALAAEEPPAASSPDYETYTFEKGGIAVDYPKGWKVGEVGPDQTGPDKQGLHALFTPPDNSSGPAKLVVQIFPGKGKSRDMFVAYMKDTLKQEYPDVKTADDRTVKVAGIECALIDGKYTGEGGVKKRTQVIIAVVDDVAYAVIYSNSEDKFAACTKMHKHMCDSLAIGGKPQFAAAQEIKIGELAKTEVKAYGVSIKAPKGWETVQQANRWLAYSEEGPQGARAVVQISVEETKGRTFDKVVEDAKKSLGAINGYKEISSNGTITAGSLKGRVVMFDETVENDVKVRCELAIFLKDKYAYYVVCAYTPDQFERMQPGFKQIIGSLEVAAVEAGKDGGEEDVWGDEGNNGGGEKPPAKDTKPDGKDTKPPSKDTGDERGDGGATGGAEKPPAKNGAVKGGFPVPVGELTRTEFEKVIALKVPKDWTPAASESGIIINSKPDTKQNKYVAQIILSEDEINGRTLDKIVSDGKDTLKGQVQNYKEISVAAIKAGNLDGKVVTYEQDTPLGRYRVSWAVFVSDKAVFYIFCAYSTTGYDKMAPLFEQIQKSFEVLKVEEKPVNKEGDTGKTTGKDEGKTGKDAAKPDNGSKDSGDEWGDEE